jgi:hypothetical protein
MSVIGKLIKSSVVLHSTTLKIFLVFRRQRLNTPMLIVYFVLLISLLFAFLAYAPVLSPFIYPLF